MTEQSPITPPDELVASMIMQTFGPLGPTGLADKEELAKAFASFSAMVAQWGADQELEAIIRLAGEADLPEEDRYFDGLTVASIMAARRPKPPSLKE